MAPKKAKEAAVTKQVGLGAWIKKGIVMADDIKFEPPTGASDKKPSVSGKSTRKRKPAAGDSTAADAAKAAKKPRKAGPTREHEQMYWDQGVGQTLS